MMKPRRVARARSADYVSVSELAHLAGLSTRSIWRFLPSCPGIWRTAGGHVRIPRVRACRLLHVPQERPTGRGRPPYALPPKRQKGARVAPIPAGPVDIGEIADTVGCARGVVRGVLGSPGASVADLADRYQVRATVIQAIRLAVTKS